MYLEGSFKLLALLTWEDPVEGLMSAVEVKRLCVYRFLGALESKQIVLCWNTHSYLTLCLRVINGEQSRENRLRENSC